MRLRLDPRNARKHNDENIALIDKSLQEIGPFRSIAVDRDGVVRAGNATFQRALELGLKVAVVDADENTLVAVRRPDLFGERAERAGLLDNRSAELSDWDTDVLASIAESDRQILAGIFSESEIAAFSRMKHANDNPGGPAPVNLDKAEEYLKKWKCEEGQLWQIPSPTTGTAHYLYIGDIRAASTVNRLSGLPTCIGAITSPPYAEQRAAKYGGIPTEEYVKWWEAVQMNVAKFIYDESCFFVNIKPHCENGERTTYTYELVKAMVDEWDWRFIDEFSWVKPGYPGDMGKRFKNGFEPIYQFAKGMDYKFRLGNVVEYRQSNFGGYVENLQRVQGERGTDNSHDLDEVRPSNVLHLMPDKTSNEETGGHPARFPPELPEFFIKAYSDEGDVWLDPFAGSGTTGIVCERFGRASLMVELMPKYAASILERFQINFGVVGEVAGNRSSKRSKR